MLGNKPRHITTQHHLLYAHTHTYTYIIMWCINMWSWSIYIYIMSKCRCICLWALTLISQNLGLFHWDASWGFHCERKLSSLRGWHPYLSTMVCPFNFMCFTCIHQQSWSIMWINYDQLWSIMINYELLWSIMINYVD